MNIKKVKKNLTLNKLIIQDLDHNLDTILEKDKHIVVKAGSEGEPEGITKSPKYCLP